MPPRKLTAGASDVISDTPVLQINPLAAGQSDLFPGGGGIERPPTSDAPSGVSAGIARGVQAVAKEQGGISTVYISDLAKKMGLPIDVLHEVLPELSRRGAVNLHESSSTKMTPEQRAGELTLSDGRKVHTLSLPK